MLALEELHGGLCGRAEIVGRFVGRQISKLHQPLLQGNDLLTLIMLLELNDRRWLGRWLRSGRRRAGSGSIGVIGRIGRIRQARRVGIPFPRARGFGQMERRLRRRSACPRLHRCLRLARVRHGNEEHHRHDQKHKNAAAEDTRRSAKAIAGAQKAPKRL